MVIPNAEHAVVDIRKLRDYCLDPLHPEGKHSCHSPEIMVQSDRKENGRCAADQRRCG